MIGNRQLVINNLKEKIRIFTYVVNGKFIQEEDFIFVTTEIPTDTFNVLLPKSSYIKVHLILEVASKICLLKNIPLVRGLTSGI